MTTLAPPVPVTIGPTWQRNGDGKWLVPAKERTLGWDALDWTASHLLQPDGDRAGEPWVFSPEQMRFLLWWYAIDEHGRFIYDSGLLRRMKGWGKDPLAAALCCVELVGPCRFAGWRPDGRPLTKSQPAAWIELAAVSQEQTATTMALFPAMLSRETQAEYEMDIGKTVIYAERGARRLMAKTSSPKAMEGARATFQVKNESHHWVRSNEGHAMSEVMARNAAKVGGRVLGLTNAHAPGGDSDAEHDLTAATKIAQEGRVSRFLYDSLEAPADVDLESDESVREAIMAARGNSEWVDPDRLLAEIRDPRTSEAMTRRFYFNQIHAEEDKPFDADRWAELERPRHIVPDGALITLGFDGSISEDHTALIGTEVATGHQWVVGYWEPEFINGEQRIPYMEVDETVDAAFRRWKVWRMNADPHKWRDMLAAWAGRYGADLVVEYWTDRYRRMATDLVSYRDAIQTGALSHDGDRRFTAGIVNSHKHMRQFTDDQGERMWTIQKERPDSPLKIDAAMAGCLSWQAYTAAIATGVADADEEEAGVMFV